MQRSQATTTCLAVKVNMETQAWFLWFLILGSVFGVLGFIYYKNLDAINAKPRKTGKKAKEYWSLE